MVFKFRSEEKQVEVVGMNEASAGLVGKLGTHDKAGAGYTIGSH
jgi:SulP family sulfate permease